MNKPPIFRFDDVEVREGEFSLTKAGKVCTVEPKAFRALLFLLRNPQRLVSKEELIQWVWGETAVGDGSLTRCIWLLRRLLGDDISEPRYIETVATVGYRFIGKVEVSQDIAGEPEPAKKTNGLSEVGKKKSGRKTQWGWGLGAGGVLAVFCALGFAVWWFVPRPAPVVESITQLTEDPQSKSNLITEGSRIYFKEGWQGSSKPAVISLEGGRSVPIETPLADPVIVGAARDGSELLAITDIYAATPSGPLWSIRLPAGEPRRLGNAVVQSADIFPDNRILYAVGNDILIAENDASGSRKLASLPGTVWNTVISPDGTRVLFQVGTPTTNLMEYGDTFELRADGTGLRQIRKADANECCFHWS
jgi:DNA-binding winged helix-turn-helix (wHTH) protein